MAHIPDGFLSAPVLLGTALTSAAVLAVAARRSRAALAEREVPLLGAITAFVFAAQMLNFPIAAGTSAHLRGDSALRVGRSEAEGARSRGDRSVATLSPDPDPGGHGVASAARGHLPRCDRVASSGT